LRCLVTISPAFVRRPMSSRTHSVASTSVLLSPNRSRIGSLSRSVLIVGSFRAAICAIRNGISDTSVAPLSRIPGTYRPLLILTSICFQLSSLLPILQTKRYLDFFLYVLSFSSKILSTCDGERRFPPSLHTNAGWPNFPQRKHFSCDRSGAPSFFLSSFVFLVARPFLHFE